MIRADELTCCLKVEQQSSNIVAFPMNFPQIHTDEFGLQALHFKCMAMSHLGNGVDKVEEVDAPGRRVGILELVCNGTYDFWGNTQGGTLQRNCRGSMDAVLCPDQARQLGLHAHKQHLLIHLQHNYCRSA